MEKHEPATLTFWNMMLWNSGNAKAEFTSNKGCNIEVPLLPEEMDAIKVMMEAARKRAIKMVPEMIAEVIAEERVNQILAKREQDALELTNQTIVDSLDTEVPF